MKDIAETLMDYIVHRSIINTHCHHLRDLDFSNYDLDVLLKNSYVAWCNVAWDSTPVSRANLLEKVRFNAAFVWLQKSLVEVYHLTEPLTAENWDNVSSIIRVAHQDKAYHIGMMQNLCGYEKILEDAYWDPGSDLGHSELFIPIFRVNSFLFGYSPEARDHDGNNALILYNRRITDIDEYINFVYGKIREMKKWGCVALKVPVAYDRRLDFTETPKEAAQKAFNEDRSEADIKAFQDYVFFEFCKMASEESLPIQVHTGMGRLRQSNAMWLREAIEKNPATKFVLLHCSYPWTQDISALLRYYPNVYPDLSFLPLLSTVACQHTLHDMIEGGTREKVCWGCDTWTPEESYGSLLAFRHSMVRTMTEKVGVSYLSLEDAKMVMDNITYHNAKSLYKL